MQSDSIYIALGVAIERAASELKRVKEYYEQAAKFADQFRAGDPKHFKHPRDEVVQPLHDLPLQTRHGRF